MSFIEGPNDAFFCKKNGLSGNCDWNAICSALP
jgi:hypothetical protein